MSIDLLDQSFVMIFRRDLVIGITPKAISGRFQVDGVVFASVDDNHFVAFFDRLLDVGNRLVGVCISPISEPATLLMHGVRHARYVTAEAGAFQVWFSEAPLGDAPNNGEQAFGGQVFRAATGEFALSIDADVLLSVADEMQLQNANARWVTIAT